MSVTHNGEHSGYYLQPEYDGMDKIKDTSFYLMQYGSITAAETAASTLTMKLN